MLSINTTICVIQWRNNSTNIKSVFKISDTIKISFKCVNPWSIRLAKVLELRAVIVEFLLSKNHLLTEYFLDNHFLMRVAYLADMFSALCAVNASLQSRETIMFQAIDLLGAFSDKFKLWKRRVQRGQLEHFHNLKNFIDAESIECTFQSVIIEHIDILLNYLEQYFEDDIVMCKSKQWVKFPFDQSTSIFAWWFQYKRWVYFTSCWFHSKDRI